MLRIAEDYELMAANAERGGPIFRFGPSRKGSAWFETQGEKPSRPESCKAGSGNFDQYQCGLVKQIYR